jgi:hypothetical protein
VALRNIITPANPQMNSRGEPVAGGFVFLYEPGTTTFITSYFGADLVTPHQNPVRLSGSGRADIWITLDCDMVITDRNGNTVLTQDNANPASLGGETSSLVPNGSFEIVTTPPVPDGWTALDDAGSTNAVDSTQSTDGANSYRFTSAGSGGGSLTTTDFFPVNAVDQLRVNFDLFSDVAAVLNIVRVEWYDVTFVSISDSDVYSSTANPATWTEFQLIATPPPLARFAKLKLIGIDPSVLLAGNTYFDRIAVFYPTVVSGIFDNITIQDNEIISTNLNGEISLKPNGLGPVNIFSTGVVDLADVQNPLNISNLLDPAVSPHIAFDATQVQAKADATNDAPLFLNPLGGNVLVGAVTGTGTVLLQADTNARAQTQPASIFRLISDDLGNPVTPDNITLALNLVSQAASVYARLGYSAGIDLKLENLARGGLVSFASELAAGGQEIFAQSTTAALGGLFANNQLTGAGLERVLTTPGDASALLPTGTVTNSTLRWDGAAWIEETDARIDNTGEIYTNDLRSLGGVNINVNGLTEADPGMFFRDGAGISFEDVVQSGNPIFLNNKGVGTPTLALSGAGGGSLRLLNLSMQLRNAGDTLGATFSFLAGAQNVVNLSGPDVFAISPGIKMTQRTAATAPIGAAVTMSFWPEDAVVDDDIQMFSRVGQFPSADRVFAQLNPKRIANTSLSLSGSAQNSQHAMNSTFFYDDGASYTITLEDSGFERFPIQSTFTILVPGSNVITVAVGSGGSLFFIDPGTGTSDVGASCTIGTGGTSGFATVYRDSATDWFILGSGITA